MARAGGHERSCSAIDMNHPADSNFPGKAMTGWYRTGLVFGAIDSAQYFAHARRRQADASSFTSLRIAPSRPVYRDWLVTKVNAAARWSGRGTWSADSHPSRNANLRGHILTP